MTDKPLQIPIDKIKADFQTFLAPKHNRRIIFSGPFGIGKTYFLNEFFEEKESDYFPVFLRPINYSLLSNEDVFKFIKYDVLSQLVQNEKFEVGDNFDFSAADYAKFYTGQNGFSILFNLLKYAPKVGAFVKASKKLGILVDKFKEGLKEVNENAELKMLKEFGEQAENHFLYENDGVTEFISEQLDILVTQAEGEETKQKKVLIIDDLDRLDPEHIFRLFNVFSAHFDQVNYYENSEDGDENRNDNKFGFDKIIFVCDIENIRKIFAHKYGGEVDFSGYIDKFYSTEIYRFFHDVRFEEDIYPYFEDILRRAFNDEYNSMFFNSTKLIFQILFENSQFSVRDMQRMLMVKKNFFNLHDVIPFEICGAKKDSYIGTYGLLISLRLFLKVFGHKEILSKKLSHAISNNRLDKNRGYFNGEVVTIIPQLLMFSEIDVHKFRGDQEFEYILNNEQSISYKLIAKPASPNFPEGHYSYWIPGAGLKEYLANDFLQLLSNSIDNILKYGLIK